MAVIGQTIKTTIDGTELENKTDGRGIGPVSIAAQLAIVLTGLVVALLTLVLPLLGVTLLPAVWTLGTTFLTAGLTLLFTYYTPSKKFIQVVEVISKQDVDGNGAFGVPDGTGAHRAVTESE